MRRAAPIIIIVVGFLALFFVFWPNVKVPVIGDTSGTAQPRKLDWVLGLDLQGGFRVEYQAVPVDGKSPTSDDMNTIKTIIENRVNSTGVSEPVVQTQGTDQIVVELPGVTDSAAIEQLVGSTGRLDFVPLPADRFGNVTSNNGGGAPGISTGQPIPAPALQPLFSGDQVASANPGTDSLGGRAVAFTLKSDGARLFSDYTSQHVGEYFAIVLDDKVVSAPSIQSPITDGSGIITGGTGGFSASDMNNLVTILRYGSLPFPITQIANDQVPATLGAQFLQQTLLAAAIGIALVFAFMLIYYRLPGVVASFALVYYTLVVLAIFRLIPVTLTLAGIAGFVLSVGMAVDANILIFERTKEELRVGKPLSPAIEAGFSRAWNSILDSNVSSLITAGILYWFGSSTIKGFALVLIIGVLTSMFTAIVVTRTVLRIVVRQRWAQRPEMYGVREEEFLARTPSRTPLRGEARGRV